MSRYFTALDGANEPTIWEERADRDPEALIRCCDLPAKNRSRLWSALLLGLECEVRP